MKKLLILSLTLLSFDIAIGKRWVKSPSSRPSTNTRMCTPVFGAQVKFILFAGLEATSATLLRFYVLHVLFFPFIIVIFMAIHFWRVRKDGGISGPL